MTLLVHLEDDSIDPTLAAQEVQELLMKAGLPVESVVPWQQHTDFSTQPTIQDITQALPPSLLTPQ